MGTEEGKVVSESEPLWPSFKRRIKWKSKNQSSVISSFSNYAVEISPNRVITGKSEGLVGIVSISREGELIPVILSPARKAISNDHQPVKKKKQPLGFDFAEMKVKSHDAAEISAESRKFEVRTEELAPKKISEVEEKVAVRKLVRRSWVRIGKAFRFRTVPDLHPNSRNEPKLSQDSPREGHANDTPLIEQPKAHEIRPENELQRRGHANDTPVIEQPKPQEIRPENELPDLIPVSIDQPSKSRRISAEGNSKSGKQLKSVDFRRKVNSHASAPNTRFKSQGIESADPFSSSSSSPRFPRVDMAAMPNSPKPKPNSQPKKLNKSAKRKGTQTSTKSLGGARGECEGYVRDIDLCVLIITMGCLIVSSNRLLAVICTSLWWYLLAILLKRK